MRRSTHPALWTPLRGGDLPTLPFEHPSTDLVLTKHTSAIESDVGIIIEIVSNLAIVAIDYLSLINKPHV